MVCHDPPSVLPPDRDVRHEMDLIMEPNYALHGSGPFQSRNATSLTNYFVNSMQRECSVIVYLHSLHPLSV